MSIYATIADIKIEWGSHDEWIHLRFQAVSGEIGRPDLYDPEDVAWFDSWLPPRRDKSEWEDFRAVFVCSDLTGKGTEENGQLYINPVCMFTGDEWDTLPFSKVLDRIEENMPRHLRGEDYHAEG